MDHFVAGPFGFLNALPSHNSTCSVANFWARQKIDFLTTQAIAQLGRQRDELIGRKFPKRQPDELVYDLLFSALQTLDLCLIWVAMIVLC